MRYAINSHLIIAKRGQNAMNPYAKVAQDELSKLTKERAQIDKRIAELTFYLRVHHTLPEPNRAGKPQFRPRVYKRGATAKSVVLAVAEEMLATRDWIPTREILEQALARGAEINAKSKLLRVSSILSKAKNKFVSNRGKGWALKGGRSPKVEGLSARTLNPSVAA